MQTRLEIKAILLGIAALAIGISRPAPGTETTRSKIHPVSVVEADIYVNRTRVTMRLTCFAEDLELLQGVEPLQDGFYDSDELLDATQDHAQYLAEKITLRDASGELLKPGITEIIDIEIPDEGIKAGDLMKFTMGFVLEFKCDKAPEFITIQQDMVADGALLPSELKILLKQAGSDTPYMHMMKPGAPETFRFDWEKPILSEEASEKEWAEWFEDQRKKNLGIMSYSSVYCFIYITAHEVRLEVLIPLAAMASLIELERADPSFLEVGEQESAAEKITAYFSIGNPVMIDSVEVKPVFDRVDFYGLDLRDFAVQADKRRVSMASGRVGIIMSYSTKGPPTTVEITWDKFNTFIKSVDAVVFAYDEIEKTQFSMFLKNNTFKWDAPQRKALPPITNVSSTIDVESLKPPTWNVPLVSVGLIGCAVMAVLAGCFGAKWMTAIAIATLLGIASIFTNGLMRYEIENPFAAQPTFEMNDDDAKQVFAQLHKNMFRAFDYHNESDVYDALAKSVDGELLRKLYLDINQSLAMKEQGGAIARVNEVNLLDGTKTGSSISIEDPTPGFGYRCKWNLIGTIEHWGHIHQRKNQYDAEFEIQLRDDAWKITSMEVVDEEQGVVKTSLRKF